MGIPFHSEIGADGKPQLSFVGPDIGGLLRIRANNRLIAKKAQKACDIGLFADDADQLDLVSWFTEQTEE